MKLLLVRSTPVTAAILSKLLDLKLIIRAGSGVDTIDLIAASERNPLVEAFRSGTYL